jgi:hypothetical protein
VNDSDGVFTNNTNFNAILPALNPPLAQSEIVALYAAKHNPFVYFRSLQEGPGARNTLSIVAGFEGIAGLYADLGSGSVAASVHRPEPM